ncbi:MAG: C4-dicarboxylate ABC transporter permease [Verrucomicrobia bacterium]|nr:C4-dicarboxylate ABC transporter permease [Verrucomicrobiota bacterium]
MSALLTSLPEVLAALGSGAVWLALLAGVLGGLFVGAMPGLSATMGVALLVPFTFGLPIMPALALLIGVYCGAIYGGTITAVLVRTPGTPASAATIFDGFPLAQRGEGGRALAVAAAAALGGGLIGTLLLVLLAPQISGFALRFGAPEYCALAVCGLTMIVAVAADQMLKGAVVALGGLLLSTVGLDPISGYPRYIFGAVSLMEGISFIPALIGLFAVSEALRLAEPGAETGAPAAQPHGWWVRRVDAVRCAWTTVKSAAIGTFVGAMPGAGCDIAAFLGYSEAKRAARPDERFGKGEVKGVAAPEAAKTAATSGAMIPLLSLGVPGDSVTAVMIGAFVIHGLQPGPLMFKEQQGLVHAVFALVLLAHLLVFAFGTLGARVFLRLVNVDRRLLAPVILLLSVVGAYAMRGNLADVWLMLGFGALGYAMQRGGYPVAPLILALILGPMAEENYRRALVMSDGSHTIFLTRPIAVVLLALAVATVALSAWRRHRRQPGSESHA